MAGTNLNSNIISTYDNIPFSEKYSFDIWFTIVFIMIVIIILIYMHFVNTVQSEKINWEANKCNPAYMPFAAMINGENGKFSTDNLNECLNSLNADVNKAAKSPIDRIFQTIRGMFSSASSAIFNFISFIKYLFAMILELIKNVFARLELIIRENTYLYMNVVNFLNSLLGIVTNLFNTVMLVIDSLKLSFFIAALTFHSTVVLPAFVGWIALLVVSIVLSILSMIPLFGWIVLPFSVIATLACLIFFVFFIFTTLIYIFLKKFAISTIEASQKNLGFTTAPQ